MFSNMLGVVRCALTGRRAEAYFPRLFRHGFCPAGAPVPNGNPLDMGDEPDPKALRELNKRLAKAREGEALGEDRARDSAGQAPQTAMGVAFRVSVEIISAVAVGVGIGLLIDYAFDSGPWGLLVFTLLGGIAGMLNVYRLAKGFGYAAGYRRYDVKDGPPPTDKKDH